MKSDAVKDGRATGPGRFTPGTPVERWVRRGLALMIAAMLVSCASTQEPATTGELVEVQGQVTPAPSLSNTSWRVVELRSVAVVDTIAPTLLFDSAGQVSGVTGCNRYTGTATLSGKTLTFSPLATTRMACIDTTRMAQEQQFLGDMQGVRGYELSGDARLRLQDANGATVILLTRLTP